MMAGLALGRRAPARRGARPRASARYRAVAARPRARSRRREGGLSLFTLSALVLATAFLLALLYLRSATAITATGFDLQAMEAQRVELRREVQLLEVQVQRLDAPSRIEAEAQRLGLEKAPTLVLITTEPPVAGR